MGRWLSGCGKGMLCASGGKQEILKVATLVLASVSAVGLLGLGFWQESFEL